MELYIRKRVSAADFLGIFREYSVFLLLMSYYCLIPYVAFLSLWKIWLNQCNNGIPCLISVGHRNYMGRCGTYGRGSTWGCALWFISRGYPSTVLCGSTFCYVERSYICLLVLVISGCPSYSEAICCEDVFSSSTRYIRFAVFNIYWFRIS